LLLFVLRLLVGSILLTVGLMMLATTLAQRPLAQHLPAAPHLVATEQLPERSRVHRPDGEVEVQASPIPVWRQRARVYLSVGGSAHPSRRAAPAPRNHPAVWSRNCKAPADNARPETLLHARSGGDAGTMTRGSRVWWALHWPSAGCDALA
jgi:hypothetical protein